MPYLFGGVSASASGIYAKYYCFDRFVLTQGSQVAAYGFCVYHIFAPFCFSVYDVSVCIVDCNLITFFRGCFGGSRQFFHTDEGQGTFVLSGFCA